MLLLALTAQQIGIIVALLVALAIVFALLSRFFVKPPALPKAPGELGEGAAKQELELNLPEVQTPAERLQREEKARAVVDAAEKSLAAAHAEGDTAAGRAEIARYQRELNDARRKLEYEQRKSAEAVEKLRRQAEAAAREEAEARARAQEAALAEETRRAETDRRQRLAELESGRTLSEGLAKTRGGFMARLNALLGTGKDLDEASLGELEEILFSADVGVRTATSLLESVRERLKRRELSDLSKVKAALREEIERILSLGGALEQAGHGGLPALPAGVLPPQVVMVVGVNGTGKTTTIGKLAARVKGAGRSVLLGAGDTFRAAAGEQLDVWADRAKVPIVRGKDGGDPGAVLFDAITRAKADHIEVVLCDTAGRLHTKATLMDELKGLKRTLGKAHAGAPHEVLLVVDATNGQNAIQQARQFHDALGVTGFVLTKLDGTAKGGVIIGICDELKIPVRYVGVGEKVADLKPFDPREFVEALFGD